MGYESEIKIEFVDKACYSDTGGRIVDLVDRLIISGWKIDFYGKVPLLDKGNDFNFIYLDFCLTNTKIIELLQYKEIHKEFILISLHHINSGKGIDLNFDYKRKYSININLTGEDKKLRILDPIKEINKYMALIYIPILEWGKISNVRYITGYDYKVIKEFKGKGIIEQIKHEIKLT